MSETSTAATPAASADADGPDPEGTAPPRPPADDDVGWLRRLWRRDRSVLVVTAIVALGFVLVLRGVLAGVTGDERAGLPPLIESVQPVPDAVQIPNQSNVVVDLAPDQTGVLIVDGIEIETINVDEIGRIDVEPGEQVDLPPVTIFEPGNATLTFTPGAGAPIEEFTDGVHEVEVLYWRVDEDRRRARRYTWTFTVV